MAKKNEIYAYSISINEEFKTVSCIFTDQKVEAPAETQQENSINFVSAPDTEGVKFGSFPMRLPNGKRMRPKNKAAVKKLEKDFKFGTPFKSLRFGKKVKGTDNLFKVKVRK